MLADRLESPDPVGMKAHARRLLTALLAAASLLGSCAALPASASATVQLGAYTPGAPASAQALSGYAAMVGRQPDIVMWYREFEQPLIYSNEAANLRATGQTPMVTWEPAGEDLSQIAAGAYDGYLEESARIAKSWGGTLLIRFAHEMNGTWFSWSGSNSSPADFVAAWRHVVSVFRAEGAGNVRWVWSPNIQEGGKYPIAPYFPGEEFVDYVGLDGYNWGTGGGEKWQSIQEVFGPSYAIVTQLSSKPVMIAETSSSEAGGEKAAWIHDAFLTEIPRDFPRVAAVVWFNKVKEDDWRIDSSQASLDAYRAVASCSLYGGSERCETASPSAPAAGEPHPSEGGGRPKKGRKRGRPVVRSLRVTRRARASSGVAVSYRLSQAAGVRIAIVPRRRGGARVALRRHGREGRNEVSLGGLIHRHRLGAGGYRLVVVARRGGRLSQPRRACFRVL